ncbi:MAG: VWA domain-containing protein [Caldilineaceae bacterium]
MSQYRRSVSSHSGRNILIGVGLVLVLAITLCSATFSGGMWLLGAIRGDRSASEEGAPAWSATSPELTVAVSPLMYPVLDEIAGDFNASNFKTQDGQLMKVNLVAMDPQKIVDQALGSPDFQAISPDSSLWLDQLEQAWASTVVSTTEGNIPIGQGRTSGQTRYAVSPLVIVAWENVARELGWPDKPIGWQDIQNRATSDPDFKWNHAGTNTASGLLATLAEFYAGANLTRGLTEESATAPGTLEYVQAVESTVRFYGEGEDVIVQRLADEGRDFLDAFVGQESVVIDWNSSNPDERLVAIYPAEGSLWTDHPLALLELGSVAGEFPVTDNQRQTYAAFSAYVTSEKVQNRLLETGYRPADLSIALDRPGSPFTEENAAGAVDWRQPQTTLQIPPASVVNVVRDAWRYTKRPTKVYLVVDTSGSMEGAKIEATREALAAFVNEVQGDRDEIGIVEFASDVKGFTPLRVLDDRNRQDTLRVIGGMEAMGGTALIDAVYAATVDLQAQADGEAINAIVVMTDGLDNESARTLNDLDRALSNTSAPRVVLFTIAFGDDADDWILQEMARSGQGQFRRADETDIEELYRIVSTYF